MAFDEQLCVKKLGLYTSAHRILVVGDGNFSFSFSLGRELGGDSLTATSLQDDFSQQPETRKNLDALISTTNATVKHGVDATRLAETLQPEGKFDRIVFMFPHHHDGEIHVALCQGQGGTELDPVQRLPGNHWQVVEQAAKSGLILTAAVPLESLDYPGYTQAGYKGGSKGFISKGGLVHVFAREPADASRHYDSVDDFLAVRERQGLAHFDTSQPIGRLADAVAHHLLLSPQGSSVAVSHHVAVVRRPCATYAPSAYPLRHELHAEGTGIASEGSLDIMLKSLLESFNLMAAATVNCSECAATASIKSPDAAAAAAAATVHHVARITRRPQQPAPLESGSATVPGAPPPTCVFNLCVDLDALAMVLWSIPDVRYLWLSPLPLEEDRGGKLRLRFRPPSLSPPRHVMDVSFLLRAGADSADVAEAVADVVRAASADCAEAVEALPALTYYEERCGLVSVCYRIRYRAIDRALPRALCIHLHECRVKPALMRRLGPA